MYVGFLDMMATDIFLVKTLAIRNTAEEVIVARSKALKESKQEFAKEVVDDRTIRDFIEVCAILTLAGSHVVTSNYRIRHSCLSRL